MELIVLGAGPAYTDRPDASGAAYLVAAEGAHLLLDLGQGSFQRLFPHVDPADLAAVVVSHLHPDHFIDLVPLRHYLRFEFDPPRRVRVLAPAGLGERLDALHATAGFTAAALDVEALSIGSHGVGPFTVEAGLVTHTNESYAFRVSTGAGPGLVYSGDCGVVEDLGPLVQPGDVLLVEVSFGAGPAVPGAQHLDGPAVGRLAAATRPSRVLLTHLQMGNEPEAALESVRDLFDGPVEFVWPGDRLELP